MVLVALVADPVQLRHRGQHHPLRGHGKRLPLVLGVVLDPLGSPVSRGRRSHIQGGLAVDTD